MSEPCTLDQYVEDLRQITRKTDNGDKIITRAGPLAKHMATERTWFQQSHFRMEDEQGFLAHLLYEEPNCKRR